MVDIPRSNYLDQSFYDERARQCSDIAQLSTSIPSIRFRLEALARKYQERILELDTPLEASPPLAPEQRDRTSVNGRHVIDASADER